MNWKRIENTDDLNEAIEKSHNTPIVIFKHSTRCSISAAALDRLERSWDHAEIKELPYFLDLIRFRNVSNEIVSELGVEHESPQIIVVKDGKSIYDSSHFSISYEEVRKATTVESVDL